MNLASPGHFNSKFSLDSKIKHILINKVGSILNSYILVSTLSSFGSYSSHHIVLTILQI